MLLGASYANTRLPRMQIHKPIIGAMTGQAFGHAL